MIESLLDLAVKYNKPCRIKYLDIISNPMGNFIRVPNHVVPKLLLKKSSLFKFTPKYGFLKIKDIEVGDIIKLSQDYLDFVTIYHNTTFDGVGKYSLDVENKKWVEYKEKILLNDYLILTEKWEQEIQRALTREIMSNHKVFSAILHCSPLGLRKDDEIKIEDLVINFDVSDSLDPTIMWYEIDQNYEIVPTFSNGIIDSDKNINIVFSVNDKKISFVVLIDRGNSLEILKNFLVKNNPSVVILDYEEVKNTKTWKSIEITKELLASFLRGTDSRMTNWCNGIVTELGLNCDDTVPLVLGKEETIIFDNLDSVIYDYIDRIAEGQDWD